MDEYKQKYEQLTVLGTGAYGTVYKAKSKKNGQFYAAKIIHAGTTEDAGIRQEVEIMRRVAHKNCMSLVEAFNLPTDHSYHRGDTVLILELIAGGELFERLVSLGAYTEKDAAEAARAIVEGMKYLHDNNICHRDIKPENLLLVDETPHAEIKISDYGLATLLDGHKHAVTHIGTYGYMAPEVLKCSSQDKPCDIFSLGVVLYIMLCGYSPWAFEQCNEYEPLDFPQEWDAVSEDAKNVVRAMLHNDPAKRPTAAQLLEMGWFKGKAESRDLSGALQELKKFNAKRKFKSGISSVKAVNKLLKMSKLSAAAKQIPAAAETPKTEEKIEEKPAEKVEAQEK